MVSDEAVGSLYRYFVRSNFMRIEAEKARRTAVAEHGNSDKWPASAVFTGSAFKMWMYLDYWWSALFVVVEGYEKLGLEWPGTEALLKSPLLPKLRRYRAGTYHFQRAFFDPEQVALGSDNQGLHWMSQLHDAIKIEIHAEIDLRKAASRP